MEFSIDIDLCKIRQARLLDVIHAKGLTGAVVFQNAHVQWLTGVYTSPLFCAAAFLDSDGELTLIAPHKIPEEYAADSVERYDAKFHSTMRNDQNLACVQKLAEVIGKQSGPLGVEYSSYGIHSRELIADRVEDIEPDLLYFRRRKDADELAKIQHAINATEKMYVRAREIIRPGITEIEVFNELQSVAVEHFGEAMTGTGNDYQCGSRGGLPRNNREAQPGELYILDLGPAFRGFYADNARTIAVSDPTEDQTKAWEYIMKAFEHVESEVRPGKSCKGVFEEVQEILDQSPVGVFNHHLGHGIGMFPHEAPHLNPNWDDTFEVGDVFTAEPGLYDVELLKAGMRIENDYVVTESGVQKLTDFPLNL